MHEPFTLQEVKNTVFSCASDKALGPDGFPLLFYQYFWELLKEDVMEIFHRLHGGNLELKELNGGWVYLCPKKPDAIEMRDFRPICMINGSIKIIAKVLANRLL